MFGGEITNGPVATLTGADGGAGGDTAVCVVSCEHDTLTDVEPVALPAEAEIDAEALPVLGAENSACTAPPVVVAVVGLTVPAVVDSSTVVPSAAAAPLAPFTATVTEDEPPHETLLALDVTLSELAPLEALGGQYETL